MRKVLLLLIGLIALGCSKKEDKEEDFSKYKLNVPEWLVGRWEYISGGIDYSFEFTKDDYRFFNGSYFETQKSRLVEQKEYSYEFRGNNRHMYYFIEFRPQSNTYYKHSYEWAEWTEKSPYFEGREMFKIKYEKVTKYGVEIDIISEREDFYRKVK
jgi:lipoprotein